MSLSVASKVVAAVVCLGVVAVGVLWMLSFQFSHPEMTDTQRFTAMGWVPYALLPFGIAAAFLFDAAQQEDEDDGL